MDGKKAAERHESHDVQKISSGRISALAPAPIVIVHAAPFMPMAVVVSSPVGSFAALLALPHRENTARSAADATRD